MKSITSNVKFIENSKFINIDFIKVFMKIYSKRLYSGILNAA